ncbi:MAG: S53 family peptidase, partial [Acidimicrobiaceae bacterium]|nr:S53 family peptidase [Acidimicrobiaceae bacterium]
QCEAALGIPCYQPGQLQTAYDEQPLFAQGNDGAGQTIAIVDAFGSPTIQADLATFDQEFGLPNPPSFQVIQPAGAVPPFDPNNATQVGWAGETTLDVEWAHAMAPGANIVLAETPVSEDTGTSGFSQIVQAENFIIANHLGSVISQSFGTAEETFPNRGALLSLRGAYMNAARAGVTVLASSGDTGSTNATNAGTLFPFPTTSWPATDPLVTAVGGTQLQLDASGQRTAPDQVWNDTNNQTVNQLFFGNNGPNAIATGGGLSAVFPRPANQNAVASTVGGARGIPDISMSAACSGPVLTFSSFPGQPAGFSLVCGTSESSPVFAGIVSLAAQAAGHPLGLINPALYQLSAQQAAGLVDVTSGNNTVSFPQNNSIVTVPGFSAGAGYDLASGVGTLDAAQFVPELAQAASAQLTATHGHGHGHGHSGER